MVRLLFSAGLIGITLISSAAAETPMGNFAFGTVAGMTTEADGPCSVEGDDDEMIFVPSQLRGNGNKQLQLSMPAISLADVVGDFGSIVTYDINFGGTATLELSGRQASRGTLSFLMDGVGTLTENGSSRVVTVPGEMPIKNYKTATTPDGTVTIDFLATIKYRATSCDIRFSGVYDPAL